MTVSSDAINSVSGVRTGYLPLVLPAAAPAPEVPALIHELVIEALAASGEWPVRIDVVTSQRVLRGPMRRWFVEYAAAPGAVPSP